MRHNAGAASARVPPEWCVTTETPRRVFCVQGGEEGGEGAVPPTTRGRLSRCWARSAQGRYIETLHAYFQSSRLVGAVARPPRRRWNVPFPTSVVPCTVRGAEVVVCARFF